MSATSIYSYKATSRSLNDNHNTQKGNKSSLKNVFSILFLALSIAFCSTTLCAAGERNTNQGTANSVDILRQDLLRFIGPMAEKDAKNFQAPSDGYLVRLNRRIVLPNGEIPMTYGMLVRGVDPVEQALLQDAQDGKWDNFDLFRAALIVEGVRDPKKIREYESRLEDILARVHAKEQADGTVGSTEALTKDIFEALHREVLTQPYDINCTNLGRVFETGHFNCVSATVLFNCIAEKAGLNVCALEMPGHALSRVKFGSDSMNLETTCPTWFSLQNETARKQATLRRVASAPAIANPALAGNSAPVANELSGDSMKKLREITPVQLIATIYYNQGVDFLAEKRYAEAAMANIKALHLDPTSETAWGNLLATLNNWAIELAGKSPKRYDLAATLLDQGVYLDPNYDKFRANQLHIFYHWIRELAVEGRVADAQKVFGLADQRLPNDPDLKTLMQAINAK